ncbi:MAG: PDC sensor domain-containing protein [Paracoccaceae bacterium]
MKTIITAIAATLMFSTSGFATEFDAPLQALASSELAGIAAKPEIVAAVQAQNVQHAEIGQARIDELDATWRAETGSGGALVNATLGKELSVLLRKIQEESGGIYTEIFVMDNVGLNVAQSSVTSDYWQGDEAKWQVPFNQNTAHFGDVELDQSTQTYQSQISLPVLNEAGQPIGAVTFGVNIEMLMQ